MQLLRTMLALLIAVALAALPVGATAVAAPVIGPGEAASLHVHADAAAGAAETASAESCDQHGMAGMPAFPPATKPHAKCPLGFCCVGAIAAFNAVAATALKFRSDRQGRVFTPADHSVPDHAGSPPFRPPRA